MRLTTCMFWYAEPLDELHAQVSALKGFADRLVAVNGRWDRFPIPSPDSSREEINTVIDAAYEAGIDLTLTRPVGTWAGEVAQRNYTLKLALTDADWIFLTDADERLVHFGPGVRDELAQMEGDVGTIDFQTLHGPREPATTWEDSGMLSEQRRLFRAEPGMRYVDHHWWLRDGRQALWGEMPNLPFAKAHKLDVCVEHRTCIRDSGRWALKDEFRAWRDPADVARGHEL